MKSNRQLGLRFGYAVCGFLGAACDDPLEKAQVIADVRVIGARVEVLGEPTRASPAPGERARVELFVAAPEPSPMLGWTLSVCPIAPSNAGIARCAAAPFATSATPAPVSEAPILEFDLPLELDQNAPLMLAVQGRICDGAIAERTGLDATCVGAAPGTALSFEFPVLAGGVANQNPSFSDVPVLLDGVPWPKAEYGCDSPDVPHVSAGSGPHVVELVASETAREPLPRSVSVAKARESLQFSHFSDQLELERVFSTVPDDVVEAKIQVGFVAPASVSEVGLQSRFWFVLRDLRGGAAFIERSLCVFP